MGKKKRKSNKPTRAARQERVPERRPRKRWPMIAGAVLALLLVIGLVVTAIAPFFQR